MKTLPVLIFGLLSLCVTSNISVAQNISSQPIQVTVPSPTPYAITAQDANSRIWSRTVYELDPSGKVVTRQRQYHELASGLNHLVNGQYMASSEEINILPDGTAEATNGQHQARFPGDIYQGEIQLLTPDGQLLQSRPLALAYFDGTNTVVIAELTNSVGLVSGNNQVIYPDAFNTLSGFKADLRYTYTKAGFSQDVILRMQPPTPESLGLNGDTARLQIMTEFFSPPPPAIQSTSLPVQAGLALTDESLGFGTMQMVPGRAFLLGQNAPDSDALVSKHWVQVDGRQILIEEVPVDAILEGLAALPMTAMNSNSSKNIHTASKHFQLPPQRLAAKNTLKAMMLTKADFPAKGFVLDYQTVTGTFTNYTFQGDTTYYISGSLSLLGTNSFEGGAVIKLSTNGTIQLTPGSIGNPGINWKGTAYRPVIFTAIDDDSVGDTISGSTGDPTGRYYGNPMLNLVSLTSTPTITGVRMSYAKTAIQIGGASANIYNAQFINGQYGFGGGGGSFNLRNALFVNFNTNFTASGGVTINAQNVTFSGSSCLWLTPATPQGNTLALSNCIFANLTNITIGATTASGSHNGFYNAPNFGSSTTTNNFYPFQTVGGGRYYLTNGCAFTNAGTTSIDPVLLASLKQKTIHPPISFTNVTFSAVTNFSPQAARDTNISFVGLGYHYDPLDYVFGGCIANSNFTFNAGTAVGWFRTTSGWMHAGYGIDMGPNVTVRFTGTVTAPDYWVRLNTVQEQDYTAGYGQGGIESQTSVNIPIVSGNFLRCSAMAGEQRSYFSDDYGTIQAIMVNSEFWGGALDGYGDILYYTNCLMQRVDMEVWTGNTYGAQILRNCTFIGGNFSMQRASGGALPVSVRDSAFDGTSISTADFYGSNSSVSDYDYNAYTNSTDPFSIGGSHDVRVTGSFNWQSSWFGNYYQTTNSSLINNGETNANLLGLYEFTTQTNQVKETNSIVDIGYHYVATDTSGNPLDTDGDGLPDYLADANGNGYIDPGETPWCLPPVILVQPQDQTVQVGGTAIFQVQVSSALPVTYQWREDGIAIAGATSSTLTIPNAQDVQAGSYDVVVANDGIRQVTSQDGMLVTLTLHPGSPLYTITATGVPATKALDIYGTPSLPLSHGYRVCFFGSLGQSTFTFPSPSWTFGFFTADTTDDPDMDGLTSGYERLVSGSNPTLSVTTSGGIPDGWRAEWGLDSTAINGNNGNNGVNGDPDSDGIVNLNEYNNGVNSTDPFRINSNPRPVVTIAANNPAATLGGADATFVVTRTGSTTSALTVNYTIGGTATYNTDYQISPNPGTFYPFSVVIQPNSPTATITVHALNTQHSIQSLILGLVPISIGDNSSPATWNYVVDPFHDRAPGTVNSVATPTLSPSGGTFAIMQNVIVNCATPGAVIHYTLNGNVPTTSDPIVASGGTVPVPSTATLEVKAFMSNPLVSSAVQTGGFVITYGDMDGDGLADPMEAAFGGNPQVANPGWKTDSDGDGLPDTYQALVGSADIVAPGLPSFSMCPIP